MATGQLKNSIRQIRRMALLGFTGISDAQLLGLFVAQKDDAAFEALVKRHGAMVLSVCQRILRDPHDAQDAFQATFLVLVRKAATLAKRELVGNWLYGVAFRAALKMKQAKRTRQIKERQVEPMAPKDAPEISDELLVGLDREINKLAEKYRTPLVFCDLEGLTRAQAAQKLGWPIGTLNWRLAKARSLVARGLKRHGFSFGGAALAAVFQQTAAAALPPGLVASTVKMGTLMAAGGATALGLVSAQVISLTEGVVKAMLLSKLKMPLAIMVLIGSLGAGAGKVAYQAQATEQDETRKAAVPQKPPAAPSHVELPIRATWRDSLVLAKERGADMIQDVLTFTGDASLVDEERKQSLKAQRLMVWLTPERPAAALPTEPAGANGRQTITKKGRGEMIFPAGSMQKVRMIQAFENVSLKLVRIQQVGEKPEESLNITGDTLELLQSPAGFFLCVHGNVWAQDAQKDPSGKWIKFDRLIATQLTTDNETGAINATGPGKVEHLAPGRARGPMQALVQRAKDQGAEPKITMLTRVLFEDRMFSTEKGKSRNAKFYGNVQVFHFPSEDPDATMNSDDPPKDGFYIQCNTLNLSTTQRESEASQMMVAQGSVFFRTPDFHCTATLVKFDENKDRVIFEGAPGKPATLFRKRPGMRDPDEFKGNKILYNRKTGDFEFYGGKMVRGR